MAEPFRYEFAWDPAEANANVTKHGVSFEQGATVFRDPLAITIYDDEHSGDEERWVTVGRSENGELLVVIHTFSETSTDSAAVRLISARKATKREIRDYEGPTP